MYFTIILLDLCFSGYIVISPQVLIDGMKKYIPDVDEDLVKKAYIFALDYHGTQLRDSGEPFFSHPLEVASMLIDLKMDVSTIIAGILHDTVEDTSATITQIKEEFGESISQIVNGVTKLSKFEMSSIAEKQTENFKKLLLSAASDIRVLIIKLIDRLHNMRTLKYRPKQKRYKTAKETLEIYAPLAERIGISSVKDELQDIAFMELHPDMCNSITERLKELYEHSSHIINTISTEIEKLISEVEIKSVIKGRLKTPYSIWQKMNKRNISFEQLSDIMAFRIIVDNIPQCYETLGLLHRNYLVVPGRFRDYISTPKNNGYQSLHTSVIGPLNKRIEIQIRTREMHQIAEYGVAAHWNYKQANGSYDEKSNDKQWLRNLIEILDNTSGLDEFLENSKNEILVEEIFCISPKGKIISLPRGASVLDFAYAIHSEVGNRALRAKVNGNNVPLKTVLENGDQVEIITSENAGPDYSWGNYVVTIKAKTEIKKALNGLYNERASVIGKSNIEEFFKSHNIELTDDDYYQLTKELGYETVEKLFQAVGRVEKTIQEVFYTYSLINGKLDDIQVCDDLNKGSSKKISQEVSPIIGVPEDTPILAVNCCTPVPGDRIIGLLFKGVGVEIHLEGCPVGSSSSAASAGKILDLHWARHAFSSNPKYLTRLSITMHYSAGNLSKMANVIEGKYANIVNLKIGERFSSFVTVVMEIEVRDISHLMSINATLRNCDFITNIERR